MGERRYLSTQFTDEQLDRWRAMQPGPGDRLTMYEGQMLEKVATAAQMRHTETGLDYPPEWRRRVARRAAEWAYVHRGDPLDAIAREFRAFERNPLRQG